MQHEKFKNLGLVGWTLLMNALIDTWQKLEAVAHLGGGTQRIEQQKAAGKKTVRERLDQLLDFVSFTETDKLIADGVVTGFGTIDGRTVAVYAQDFTFKGGSLGAKQAEKIIKVMDMAAKIGCPIIGIIDSGGARIDEGIHALNGYGAIFKRNCLYSGVIPQISVVLGPCAGGAAYSPALTDFVFMVDSISQMFITGPQVIAEAVHQTITKEELGGTGVHGTQSGVAHVISSTEEECFEKLKALLALLPSSYLDQAPSQASAPHHAPPSFTLPSNPNQAYDIRNLIHDLTANFFELQASFAPNIITGFARLNDMVIGIVANQPLVKAGTIDIDASCKASRFIQFCDSFGIPILSLVDTPGYLPGVEQEHNGIIRHGAKLLHAYAQATVPKITVIVRKAFGGAFIVMGSKSLGADFNFAWPEAQIAVLGARAAVTIMHGKKLAGLDSIQRSEEQKKLEDAYTHEFLNPFTAAQHGYIDAIIDPKETRDKIIRALIICRDKIEQRPTRKHANGPL